MKTLVATTYVNRKLLFLLVLFFFTLTLRAQPPNPGGGGGGGTNVSVTVSGPNRVQVNDTDTYTLSSQGGAIQSATYIVSRGTILSQNASRVTVRWTTPGQGSVQVDATIGSYSVTNTRYVTVLGTPPPPPPAPSVSNNLCGNKTLTRANPPFNTTYYWQTSASGTSTGNANKNYTVTSSRRIYLRARRTSNGQWSSASSVYATVNHPSGLPPAPSVSPNTCGNKTLTRANPPSGVTWYWQGTNGNGTSTSNSSSSYVVSQSGTYYLRARTSAGCWSTSRGVGVTVNAHPGTPATPTVSSNTCGPKTLTRGNAPSGTTWYWQGKNSNGYSTSNASSSYPATSSGTYYLRARTSAGCWSGSRGVAVTVNLHPGTPATPSVSSNTCGNKTLTRANPPSGVTWYWQGTNGNGTSTSNSASSYVVSQSGTYYLRARTSTGCWSTSRGVAVTVNAYPGTPGTPSISGNTCGNKVVT
ncbi:MAG: hypothetical protein AAGA66_14690, partial [Bacteroidota bacterium]